MNNEDPDIGQKPGPWVEIVRRAQLSRTVHSVAMTLATYASYETGRDVYPGVARLSVDCKLGYKIVKSALATLREVGLIEVVRPSPRPGLSDEYRLIFAHDLLERLKVLSPTEHQAAVEAVRAANRGKWKPKSEADLRGTVDPAGLDDATPEIGAAEMPSEHLRGTGNPAGVDNPVDAGDVEPAGYGVTAGLEPAGHGVSDLRGTPCPATTQAPRPDQATIPPEVALRADLTVVGARAVVDSFDLPGVDKTPAKCRYMQCDGKTWQPGFNRNHRLPCPDCSKRANVA